MAVILFALMDLTACAPKFGETVLSRPDEYSYSYEAKEKFVLRAIAQVFKEKSLGSNVRIDEEKQTVETDYIVQADWRTKSIARVKKINWKEAELVLSVITEKKTEAGWEQRRLLEKEQYMTIFSIIETNVYREMYKPE